MIVAFVGNGPTAAGKGSQIDRCDPEDLEFARMLYAGMYQ